MLVLTALASFDPLVLEFAVVWPDVLIESVEVSCASSLESLTNSDASSDVACCGNNTAPSNSSSSNSRSASNASTIELIESIALLMD